MDKVVAAILVLFVIVGLSFLMAIPTMLIINYLFTSSVLMTVFGVVKITFWRAFWLSFLTSGLFKSTTVSI